MAVVAVCARKTMLAAGRSPQILQDCFGRPAARCHRPLDGTIVLVVAAHVDALATDRAMRLSQGWRRLVRHPIGDAVGAQVAPVADGGPEPVRQLLAHCGLEALPVLRCAQDGR